MRSKRILSFIISCLMIFTSIPITAFAEDERNAAKHYNPWDYAIFANSLTSPININTTLQLMVSGDIHANNSVNLGNRTVYAQTVEAGLESNVTAQYYDVDREIENVDIVNLPNIYDELVNYQKNKLKAYEEQPEGYILDSSVISGDSIEINGENVPEYSSDDNSFTKKSGAFGAGFLTEMYEHPEKWSEVLPAFEKGLQLAKDSNNQYDILDLIDKSYFTGVGEMGVSGAWKNYGKLPGSIFMNHYNNGYVTNLVNQAKANNPVFSVCTGSGVTQINASWGNDTINPSNAQNASKIQINGGNCTLSGHYYYLKEAKISSYGGTQLIGNFPNLEYIYMTSYANLNLAGTFPRLKGVYMPGGQLLLGTKDLSFNANGAEIINEQGDTTLYTVKSTSFKNGKVLTNGNIAIRGNGTEIEFITEGTIFAANNTITIGDIKDRNIKRWNEVTTYFSRSGISIVNCDFSLFQGALTSRDGKMVLAGSNIETFRGYLFAQKGIDGNKTNATSGVYVETYNFNVPVGINNGMYQPNGNGLGKIKSIEFASLPANYSLVNGSEEFIEEAVQQKNEQGEYEPKFEMGLQADEDGVIFVFSENDIVINTDKFLALYDKKIVFVSKNGDIIINTDKFEMQGILYAPNGEVKIHSNLNVTIDGRIYANKVSIDTHSLDMMPSRCDIDMMNLVDEVVFAIPPFEYYRPKDIYIYDQETADIDYTLYTDKKVQSIMGKRWEWNEESGAFEWVQTFTTFSNDPQKRFFSLYYCEFSIGENILEIIVTFEDGSILEKEYKIYRLDPKRNDRDHDRLADDDEYFLGTDKNNPDTDGDGILDGDEVYILRTDPMKADSDGNGVNDGDEDFDQEGLSNYDEIYQYKTDPLLKDTDEDEFTDFYEVTETYEEFDEELGSNTNPNHWDTDGDNLSDYDEVHVYGTNPLKYDTNNNGIPDGVEQSFDHLIDTSDEDGCVIIEKDTPEEERDEHVTAFVSMQVRKENVSEIIIENAAKINSMWREDMAGYMGAPYTFTCPRDFVSATLTFTYNTNVFDGEELQPRIYYYNEKTRMLEEVPDQTVDLENGTVSANVTHFSTYILLSKRGFDRAWSLNALMLEGGTYSEDEIALMLVIDCSGSMFTSDSQYKRKELAKDLIENMAETSEEEGKISGEAGVVLFSDTDFVENDDRVCELTNDKSDIFTTLDLMDSSGGTWFKPAIDKAVAELIASDKPSKNIVMLTDGQDNDWLDKTTAEGYLEDAVQNGIVIHTIGLGSEIVSQTLRNIASITGGEYFYGASADQLIGLKDQIAAADRGVYLDADKDGLPDYYELYGMLTNLGVWVHTSATDPDTDHDGLLDGEEIRITRVNRDGVPFFEMFSDPNVPEGETTKNICATLVSETSGGQKEYDWAKIQTLLKKNVNEITDDELAGLVLLVESMTSTQKNDLYVDIGAFKRFLELGYTQEDTPFFVVYSTSDVFKKLSEVYNAYVNRALENYGRIIYRDEESTGSTQLKGKILKEVLLNAAADYAGRIQEHGFYRETGKSYYEGINLSLVRSFTDDTGGQYTLAPDGARFLRNEGGVVDGENIGLDIYDFNSFVNRMLMIFRISKEKEFLREKESVTHKMSKEAVNIIISKLPPVAIAQTAVDTVSNIMTEVLEPIEIDTHNKKVNNLINTEKLQDILGAARIGSSISIFDGSADVNSAFVNKNELQLAVNAFNYYQNDGLKSDTTNETCRNLIVKETKSIIKDGNFTNYDDNSSYIKRYINWYMLQQGQLTKYREDLQNVLTRFYALHEDDQRPCPYRTLSDLSPEQINELSSHYNGNAVGYQLKDLKLEW